jgi:hypothetical protein
MTDKTALRKWGSPETAAAVKEVLDAEVEFDNSGVLIRGRADLVGATVLGINTLGKLWGITKSIKLVRENGVLVLPADTQSEFLSNIARPCIGSLQPEHLHEDRELDVIGGTLLEVGDFSYVNTLRGWPLAHGAIRVIGYLAGRRPASIMPFIDGFYEIN